MMMSKVDQMLYCTSNIDIVAVSFDICNANHGCLIR